MKVKTLNSILILLSGFWTGAYKASFNQKGTVSVQGGVAVYDATGVKLVCADQDFVVKKVDDE